MVPIKNPAIDPATPCRLEPLPRQCHIGVMTQHSSESETPPTTPTPDRPADGLNAPAEPQRPREIGGPKGPEPTRYGDWEIGGRCIDF
jgi:hypothetical protein